MKSSIRWLEVLATVLLLFLSSIVCLGLGTEVPNVELAEMSLVDDGQEVVTRGLLVDLWKYDSGLESLVLATSDGQITLRVQVSKGVQPQPSTYVRYGDALRVFGRLSNSGSEMSIHCDGDSVSVEERAEAALTVRTLSRAWELFLGDEVRIRGVVLSPIVSEGWRLFDIDLQCSIKLMGRPNTTAFCPTLDAVVVGILGMDASSMSLFLKVVELLPVG